MPVPVLLAEYHKILASLTAFFMPKWELFLSYLPAIGWLLLVVIILSVVANVVKLLVSLRTKYTFLLLTPPRQTDMSAVSTAELFRLLHNLASYRPWYRRLFAPAPTYSFEIVSRRGTGIQYLLRVPTHQAQAVTHTLRGYLPGLRIDETNDYFNHESKLKSTIREFGLKTHFAKPIHERADFSDHDPIAYLTNAMTHLGTDELMAIQIVARPVSRLHDYSWSSVANKTKSRIYSGQFRAKHHLDGTVLGSGFNMGLQLLGRVVTSIGNTVSDVYWQHIDSEIANRTSLSNSTYREEPASDLDKRLGQLAQGKLEQPLFVASLRSLVQVHRQDRQSRSQGLAASFASFASAEDQAVIPLWSFIQPLKRWQFRKRLLTNQSVFSPSELAGVYHFPQSGTTHTEDLVRSRSRELPAPLQFKQTDPRYDNVFATNAYGGRETAIGLTLEERRRHTYIIGATGTGKTTLLSTMIHNDIVNGKGVAVVDPHGQLVEQVLRTIPEERINDVVWFAPDDDGFPVALNLLDLPNVGDGELSESQLQKQKSLVASSIISIFKKFYDEKYFGPRMEHLLKVTILTALETEQPTLQTLVDILTKKDVRKGIVDRLDNPTLKDYWADEFDPYGSLQRNQLISPITNKIGGILASPLNRNILTQPSSKLDFETVMNEGKILLCDLSKGKIGEDESAFFGSLVIAKLQLAAVRRALVPEHERHDFFLYVDEFQNFATDTFKELVSEARKYRLSTILAHQSISQIENRDIIRTLLANVGTVICFRTANPEDESFILPTFSPEVSKHDIANLPLYTCYMKVSVGNPQDAFMAGVNNFTEPSSEAIAGRAITASRQTYASKVTQVGTPRPTELRPKHVTSSGSAEQNPFPLSLTGKEYGRDWQTGSSRTNESTIQLTQLHRSILLQLYRFRFLNRNQLQSLLNLADHKHLNKQLKTLVDNHYLNSIDQGKSTAIYSLELSGIHALKAHPEIDTRTLTKYAREKSQSFIERSLLMADINLDLRALVSDKIAYGMYLSSDYPTLPHADILTAIDPHAFILRRKGNTVEQYFIETVHELPKEHLRTQLNRYVRACDDANWQRETGLPFPSLIVATTTDDLTKSVKSLLYRLQAKANVKLPSIHVVTQERLRQQGLDVLKPKSSA